MKPYNYFQVNNVIWRYVYVGNGIEPTPHSLKIVNIVMWYDCIRKLRGHVCMTMRFWRIQNKLNKTIPACGFSFIFTSLSTRTWPLHISLRNSLRNNFMKMSWISSEDPMKGISWPMKTSKKKKFHGRIPVHEFSMKTCHRTFHGLRNHGTRLSWGMELPWKAVSVYFGGHEKME